MRADADADADAKTPCCSPEWRAAFSICSFSTGRLTS